MIISILSRPRREIEVFDQHILAPVELEHRGNRSVQHRAANGIAGERQLMIRIAHRRQGKPALLYWPSSQRTETASLLNEVCTLPQKPMLV